MRRTDREPRQFDVSVVDDGAAALRFVRQAQDGRTTVIANADRQAAEYAFPYHHLPHVDEQGFPHVGRAMRGGIEYLSYLLSVAELVRRLAPARLLDVGCGDGRLLREVSSTVPVAVGVDLKPGATRRE